MDAPFVASMMPMMSAWTLQQTVAVWMMWAVMMGAMMLPSAVPVVLAHRHIAEARHCDAAAENRCFLAAYFAAWSLFSLAATAVQWLLQLLGVLSHMLVVTNGWVAGGMLIVAGAYQFTPLKDACLRACRTPIGFFVTEWRPGRIGAMRMGFKHGAYCIACCWAIMAMLFVFGVMNLIVILMLATVVAAEKLLPWGAVMSRVFGGVWLCWGLYLAVT
jgi:predicted metal-binding membrane protein